ncbi:hypothetical protein Poli38472_009804 [Pythium oligandrum]|uniref:Expansin-like EG45 domain-containing protein n=1 Tax=Pythium oligandrum TaxID=41045 RepID=A0A8K1FH40_PYTOL|nr:hypothetical protein Poli38472_009804 [Pythium oligandrum]|eukprot:TMW62311.1 hypothetical protein Poli38472_009804 [Pythium oligandrum]
MVFYLTGNAFKEVLKERELQLPRLGAHNTPTITLDQLTPGAFEDARSRPLRLARIEDMVLGRRMRGVLAVALALVAGSGSAAEVNGVVTQYVIQSPDIGSCRLKGIDSSSDNFKYYASVSAKNIASINDGCARCIKVNKDGTAINAYVLDVCQGCKDGEIKLSKSALSELSIDPNSNNATVTYKYVNCPSNFVKGNVKACLMEGASNSYIPLQFYNTQKVVSKVLINGNNATQNKDSFFYYASPQQGNNSASTWYKDVQVTLTSNDDETLTGSLAFDGTTGCATSTVQFSAASTSDADDGISSSGSSSSGGSSIVLPAVLGSVGGLIVIIGSIFFIRRRRASRELNDDPEVDNQHLSPKGKAPSDRAAYAVENSHHDSSDDPTDGEANSPAAVYNQAVSPAATAARPIATPQPTHVPAPTSPVMAPRQTQTYAPSTYSYSKPVASNDRASTISRQSSRNAPTFPAPVVHSAPSSAHSGSDDEGDRRGSFDIDDMRHTEQIRSFHESQQSVAPYSSDSPYTTGTVTSPQSYVRATALRRNSSKVSRDVPTYSAPTVPSHSSDSFSAGAPGSNFNSTGSFRESSNLQSGGYSRDSLGLLGYPYSRKPSGRNSITGTHPL